MAQRSGAADALCSPCRRPICGATARRAITPMFSVHVSGPTGVEANFTLASATLALDVALRSERAGLSWSATLADADGVVSRLSLRSLRELAVTRAADDAERSLLNKRRGQHELQFSFAKTGGRRPPFGVGAPVPAPA